MRKLYVVAALLALVGLADALYLTIEHVTGQSVRCTIISGCSAVLSSPYAVVAGFRWPRWVRRRISRSSVSPFLPSSVTRVVALVLRGMVITMFARECVVDLFTGFCHPRVLPVLFVISGDHNSVIGGGDDKPADYADRGRIWLSNNPRSRTFFVARSLCDRSIRTGRTHK